MYALNRKIYWVQCKTKAKSIWNDHLCTSLTIVGARREDFHAGKMPGSGCTQLMKKMIKFCDYFFTEPVCNYGSVSNNIPAVKQLDRDLRYLSLLYIGSGESGSNGLGYFISSQSQWT